MLPLRPRTVIEIVDAAFLVLRRAYLPLATAAALVMSPAIVLGVAVPEGSEFLLGVFQNLLSLLATGVLVVLVSEHLLGRPMDVGAALRLAWRRGFRLLVASVIVGATTMIGFLLLVVPGLLAMAFMFAVPMAIMLEDKGASDAIERSQHLVNGQVKRAVGLVSLTAATSFALKLGAVMALQWLGGVLLVPARVTAALTVIAGAMVVPLAATVNMLFYYDLRIRNEGFDLELLAMGLEGGAPAVPDAKVTAVTR